MHCDAAICDCCSYSTDVETPPAPTVVQESQVQEQEEQQQPPEGCRKRLYTYPIAYSPCYYWFKVVIGIVGAVTGIISWLKYSKDCAEAKDSTEIKIWYLLLIILWLVFGLVHLGIIVARFMQRHPPTYVLYSGAVESKIYWPMTICVGTIVIIAIVGVVLFHTDSDSIACKEDFVQVKNNAIFYIVLGVLMLLRFGRGNAASPSATPSA